MRPREPTSLDTLAFYRRLLDLLRRDEFRRGGWQLARVTPSKDGNGSYRNVVAYLITPPAACGLPPLPDPPAAAKRPGVTIAHSASHESVGSVGSSNSAATSVATITAVPQPAVAGACAGGADGTTVTATAHSGGSSSAGEAASQSTAPPFSSGAASADAPVAVASAPTTSSSASSGTTGSSAVAPAFKAVVVGTGDIAAAPALPVNQAAAAGGQAALTPLQKIQFVSHSSSSTSSATSASSADGAATATATPPSVASSSTVVGPPALVAAAAAGPPGKLTHAPLPDPTQPPARTFLVVVNYAESVSNGHIVLAPTSDACCCSSTAADAAAALDALCGPNLPVDSMLHPLALMTAVASSASGATVQPAAAAVPASGAAGTSALPAAPSSASAAPQQPDATQPAPAVAAPPAARRLGFIDHLTLKTLEYPRHLAASEGVWMTLEPWAAHVFELVQLQDA